MYGTSCTSCSESAKSPSANSRLMQKSPEPVTACSGTIVPFGPRDCRRSEPSRTWPGTGAEWGCDGLHGQLLNCPLPPDCGSDEFRAAWRDVLFPPAAEHALEPCGLKPPRALAAQLRILNPKVRHPGFFR